MFDNLNSIKKSIAYYVKQNKRLAADDRLCTIAGENAKHQQHILDNEKRIEKLKEFYEQGISKMKEQENAK